MTLRPFFSYYGGKWTLAPHYPLPEHDTIVEPFAGGAGYALRHAERDVILVEKVGFLAALWKWLTRVSVDEVMGLPLDPMATEGLPDEAKTLLGFWCARGRVRPARTANSSWLKSGDHPSSFWGERARLRIAEQVPKIRHWRVLEGNYWAAGDVAATWFVDPPYQGVGRHYLAQPGDYSALGEWCRSRRGLVVVCEAQGADWLPFVPLRPAKSIARGSYTEAVFVRGSSRHPEQMEAFA